MRLLIKKNLTRFRQVSSRKLLVLKKVAMQFEILEDIGANVLWKPPSLRSELLCTTPGSESQDTGTPGTGIPGHRKPRTPEPRTPEP